MNREQRHAKNDYRRGYKDGFSKAAPCVTKTIYAAIALALSELYGFGRKRITDVLQTVDSHVLNTLASEEIIDDVWKRVGLVLDFNDPLEPIKERVGEE